MCGRYYIDTDSEAYRAITKRIIELDKSFEMTKFQVNEVFPGGNCLVLKSAEKAIKPAVMKWTLPVGKYKLINIQSENVLSKYKLKTLYYQRCVIIASGYYEWDKAKQKHYFDEGKKMLYLAGLYEKLEHEENFAILTRVAPPKMQAIHHRAPLIIDDNQVKAFLNNEINF